jgi:hypothetical protein
MRDETPLRRWRKRTGKPFSWLVRASGCSRRTVFRAASGESINGRSALALSRATGIPVRELLEGAER